MGAAYRGGVVNNACKLQGKVALDHRGDWGGGGLLGVGQGDRAVHDLQVYADLTGG